MEFMVGMYLAHTNYPIQLMPYVTVLYSHIVCTLFTSARQASITEWVFNLPSTNVGYLVHVTAKFIKFNIIHT